MAKDIKVKIREIYDREILIPYLGKGKVREELSKGLENVLNRVNIPKETELTDNKEDILSKKIDLDETCKKLGFNKSLKRRVYNVLFSYRIVSHYDEPSFNINMRIDTYGDLINAYNKYIEKHPYHYGSSWITDRKNLGLNSSYLLHNHLNSVGIKLYGRDYTSEELGKNKK